MSKAKTFYLRQPSTGFVVQASSRGDGPVSLATWTGDASQYFEQLEQPDGYSILVNVGNGNVLDLVTHRPEHNVITFKRHDRTNQRWKVNPASVESAYKGWVLDGGSLKEGETLIGAPASGAQAQKFVAVYAPVPEKQ